MNEFLNNLTAIHFYQALIIVMFIFLADNICGIVAALASGRKIKSHIMASCQNKKLQSFFRYVIMGVGFHFASAVGQTMHITEVVPLSAIATIVVIIPVIPEILSIFENISIIKTGKDTKPKDDNDLEIK